MRTTFGIRHAPHFLLLALVLTGNAQALDVARSGRPLAQVPTQLTKASDMPSTDLHPASDVPSSHLRPQASDNSTLQPTAGPRSILREAEVDPGRLEQTRALLTELKAQTTPDQTIAIDLPADVLFDFDKSNLRTDAIPALNKAAELIRSYPSAPLTVVGHTDAKGSDAYNDGLSLRRAGAVSRELLRQTGRPALTEGLGKRKPVAPNTTTDGRDDPQGRQLNRRVQILIGLPKAGQ